MTMFTTTMKNQTLGFNMKILTTLSLFIVLTLSLKAEKHSLQFEDQHLKMDSRFKYVGKIFKTKGKGVLIDRRWGVGKHKGGKNKKLFDLDLIQTDKSSKAYLKLIDNSKIIVAKGSNMKILNLNKMEQEGGENTYDITKREKKNKLQIITNFAKINIKGTLFKVYDQKDKKKIVLHEGVLDIDFKSQNYTLYSLDPKCGEPFILHRPKNFEIKTGEALSFEKEKIYRTCFKSKKNYRDTIVLSYEKSSSAHLCYSISASFNNSKKEPNIVAFDKGCYLKVPTKYKRCKVISSTNAIETKYFIKNSKLELVLMPEEKESPSFIQYKCYR